MKTTKTAWMFLIACVAMLLAPVSSATLEVDVEATPIEEPIPLQDSRTSTITVTLTATDAMVCATGGEATVTLEIADPAAVDGLSAVMEPTTLTFTIGAGTYGVDDEVGDSNWTEDATLTVETTDNVSAMSHEFTVTGTYDGTEPGDCQATEFTEDSDSAAVAVTIEPPADNDTDDGMDDGTGDGGGDDQDSPAPAFGVLLLLALALAAIRRRSA